jgi:RNA polymerase subunit RPABC4/transcription elongation factor Spt4
MAIRCVCPKGHVLKVKESLAGTSGLCPVCRSRVRVPALRAEKVTEDTVLAILGPHEETKVQDLPPPDDSRDQQMLEASMRSGIFGRKNIVKNCSRCNQEISAGTHICPYCHTYIAQPGDF